jgi:diguanylate cyclase (GGDEF)-like protein
MAPANQAGPEQTDLPAVERELERSRLRLRFIDPALETLYQAERKDASRLLNRVAIAVLVVIFDAYLLPEMRVTQETLGLSAFLRFALLTPATIAYLLLDWRGSLSRWYNPTVTVLLIAPTLFSTIIGFWITNPMALTNYEAVPMIQLALLVCRLSLKRALLVSLVSWLLFAITVFTASFVPPDLHWSLLLSEIGIGCGTLLFAWRIEIRDRQVFLLNQQAAIGRDLLRAQNRRLARLSQVDALTGLGNRRCFDEALAAAWQQAAHDPVAISLVMFDIDCFKQFNDALGHQAGDECLVAVSRVVARCLRDERDTLVRYGGEEFAIILPATSLEDALAVADRVRRAVVERGLPHPGGGPLSLVTISLGVATVTAPHQSAESLIEVADRCLYAAKRRGRNRVESERLVVVSSRPGPPSFRVAGGQRDAG